MTKATQIDSDVLDVLDRVRIAGNLLYLPEGQLERKLYERVNKCLEALGGKWNKKSKAHDFGEDPGAKFEAVVIVSGEYHDTKKQLQAFYTPPAVADKMIEMAEIYDNATVLEPSAGRGAISTRIRQRFPNVKMALVEIDRPSCDVLQLTKEDVRCMDFLHFNEHGWGRILMNPPFTRFQDIDHITHAFSLLALGGVLVSVVSESPFFRQDKKAANFREMVCTYGRSFQLPEWSFKSSGTGVSTRLVRLTK